MLPLGDTPKARVLLQTPKRLPLLLGVEGAEGLSSKSKLRRQVAKGGPGHVPLKDPPRVGSCGGLRLERPHLGSQPQAGWLAVTRP